MIVVTNDWGWAFLIAAIAGMIGGLIYDLVLDRLGDSGLIERVALLNSDDTKRRYVDIGTWASVIIGGAAAIGFLFFLGPETRTVVVEATASKAGSTRTIREYNPFKLIPAALIVGTGGVSFVKAMREKLLKLVNETKLDALAGAVEEQSRKTKEEGELAEARLAAADPMAGAAAGRLEVLGDLARQLRR